MDPSDSSTAAMKQAVELALLGRGVVEPNPMVGCVILRDGRIVGKGWHQKFGGPHAEVIALQEAGELARDAVVFVTLEPCCHRGKTPHCTQALIAAQVSRVVVGCKDPNPQVAGKGVSELREAGIEVDFDDPDGLATALIAPFVKLMTEMQPWVIAKWAMTLDGRIATRTGNSRWITGEASRAEVHRLRGLVDGVLIGRRTAELDDPLLTTRPPGPRQAVRIVLDSFATLSTECQLVKTVDQAPLLLVVSQQAPAERIALLREGGVEVLELPGQSYSERLQELLKELGRRQMTYLLVEGGALVLGSFWDLDAVDEVHAFIAPLIAGGTEALSPVSGCGSEFMVNAWQLKEISVRQLENDIYVSGRVSSK